MNRRILYIGVLTSVFSVYLVPTQASEQEGDEGNIVGVMPDQVFVEEFLPRLHKEQFKNLGTGTSKKVAAVVQEELDMPYHVTLE